LVGRVVVRSFRGYGTYLDMAGRHIDDIVAIELPDRTRFIR
jgi:hypothetical protein